jgi:hypothetical protein
VTQYRRQTTDHREAELQGFIAQWLRGRGHIVLKRDPSPRNGDAGFPDLEVIGPRGRVVYVETKAPKGRLPAEQRDWHERLRALGHRVRVVRAAKEAIKVEEDLAA